MDICVINSDTAQGILYTLVSLRNNWENIHLIDLGSGTDHQPARFLDCKSAQGHTFMVIQAAKLLICVIEILSCCVFRNISRGQQALCQQGAFSRVGASVA